MQFSNQPIITQKWLMLWLFHTLGSFHTKNEKSLSKTAGSFLEIVGKDLNLLGQKSNLKLFFQ